VAPLKDQTSDAKSFLEFIIMQTGAVTTVAPHKENMPLGGVCVYMVYVYECMYVYIYIYTCVYLCVCLCVCMCTCLVFLCVYIFVCVCMNVCTTLYVRFHLYLYVCAYIHTYIYISDRFSVCMYIYAFLRVIKFGIIPGIYDIIYYMYVHPHVCLNPIFYSVAPGI
jgi:hypothetical protein